MSEYRYNINDEGIITRGRVYRLPDDWTAENWRWYWENDTMVAFTVNYGVRVDFNAQTSGEDTDRAIEAFKAARNYGQDEDQCLTALARRITGNWDARFIAVGLDRGCDLYALAWDGDPDREWSNEIEALNCGDIYRMEMAEFDTAWPGNWRPEEEYPEEWYGEDKALIALAAVFPETEFPAELTVEDRAS